MYKREENLAVKQPQIYYLAWAKFNNWLSLYFGVKIILNLVNKIITYRGINKKWILNQFIFNFFRNLPIMDFDLLNWFRSFDFIKYFDVTVHSMEFNNTQWKKDAIMNYLNEGFTTIKCYNWEENSEWVIDSRKLNFYLFRISYF